MIANAITLNASMGISGATNVDKIFDLVAYPTPASALRRVAGSAYTEPQSLMVSHQEFKRGVNPFARRMARLDWTQQDTIRGDQKGSVWLATDLPMASVAFSGQDQTDMLGWLIHLIGQADFRTRFLNGEV